MRGQVEKYSSMQVYIVLSLATHLRKLFVLLLSLGVFLYGGNVTDSRIVATAQMNLRPARPGIAP